MRKVIHSVKHVPLNTYPLQPLIFHKSAQDVSVWTMLSDRLFQTYWRCLWWGVRFQLRGSL